ncbi:hypothetical protein [Paenibacillus humicus]|uniref:hypothetical protein n=1 Tax=Paenibacillus humicus TaxID=412861 RepID=UPI000FD96B36|nr:hypothetical protein [Paenibacillus humicus]
MAKLNVTVPAVDVTIDGAMYRKVDRSAQEGDVVRITDEDAGGRFLVNGAFYTVDSVDASGDPHITDEAGDDFDLCAWSFEVYEKVAEEAKYKAGDIVKSKLRGFQTTLKERVPHLDGERHGKAWRHTHDSGWLGENQFEKVAQEEAQPKRLTVGDYARVVNMDGGGHNYKIGEIIKLTTDAEDSHPYKGEKASGDIGNWLFAKEIEPATEAEFLAQKAPKYREVKRPAAVGERIRIVNKSGVETRYKNGDEAVVLRGWGGSDIRAAFGHTGAEDCGVVYDEYVVLEPVDAAKPERLKVGEYAKVVNDKTRSGSQKEGVSVGEIRKIVKDDRSSLPFWAELLDGSHYEWFREDALVRATDEEVAAARRYKVGDYVQVTKPGGSHNYKIGEFVQVTEMYGRGIDAFKGLRSSNATTGNWLLPKQVIPATEAQFTMSTPKPTFNVGDTVKLTVADGKTPRLGWGGVKNGEVGTVKRVGSSTVTVDFPSQSRWNADPSELTKVSAEESQPGRNPKFGDFSDGDYALVTNANSSNANTSAIETNGKYVTVALEHAGFRGLKLRTLDGKFAGFANADALRKVTKEKAEAGEVKRAEEAKWSAIGRKVGEYKVGDIVRFKKYAGINGLNEHNGVIVEIDDLDGMNPHLAKPAFVKTGYNTYTHPDHFELVTPVEARFDR